MICLGPFLHALLEMHKTTYLFISDDLQYSLSSNLTNAGGKQKSLSVGPISLTSFLKISCVP